MAIPTPILVAAFDVALRFVTDLALQHSRGELTDEQYEERVAAILERSKAHVTRAHASWDAAMGRQPE